MVKLYEMLIERWCTFVSSISSIMTEPPPSKYWKESIFRFTFSWGWFKFFTRDNWNSRLLAYFQCSFSFLFDTILKVSWYTSVFITSKFENSSVHSNPHYSWHSSFYVKRNWFSVSIFRVIAWRCCEYWLHMYIHIFT